MPASSRALRLGARAAALCGVAVSACGGALHGAPPPRPYDAAESSAWIAPARWGSGGHLEPAIDRATLGSRALYLAFDAIPEARRALLVITPVGPGSAALVVERMSDHAELARVPIDGARPARIELPLAAHLELALRAEGTIDVATPLHHDVRARPRIELTLAPDAGASTGPISTGAAR